MCGTSELTEVFSQRVSRAITEIDNFPSSNYRPVPIQLHGLIAFIRVQVEIGFLLPFHLSSHILRCSDNFWLLAVRCYF